MAINWTATVYLNQINHSVSEENQVHSRSSNAFIVEVQIHQQSFFEELEGRNLRVSTNSNIKMAKGFKPKEYRSQKVKKQIKFDI